MRTLTLMKLFWVLGIAHVRPLHRYVNFLGIVSCQRYVSPLRGKLKTLHCGYRILS